MVECWQFVSKSKEFLTSIKDRDSVINLRKWTCNIPILDLPNIKAYAKFGQIPLICSQDIDRK